MTIQAQILGLIKELQKELNMAVIFITHDMGVVYEIADRVAVMYKGELVETGTLEQIFTSPKHAYTQALLAAAPKLGEMDGTDLPRSFPVLTMEEELSAGSGPREKNSNLPAGTGSDLERRTRYFYDS